MNLALVAPLRNGISGGVFKHLQELVHEWSCHHKQRTTVYLPELLRSSHANVACETRFFPSSDYRQRFRHLTKAVRGGSHDAALLVTPVSLDLGDLPITTIVQNVEPIQLPEYKVSLLWRVRNWLNRIECRRGCETATRVLAVSKYVKSRLLVEFSLHPSKIDVVYHGFSAKELTTVQAVQDQLPGFIFTAGVMAPYRGTEDLLQAIAILSRRGIATPPLLIAGTAPSLSRWYEASLHRMAVKLGIANRVRWLGQISHQQMAWCYTNSRIFVFTSRAEACPNIVLESLGQGCVCISCDHPPMPEFYSEAATYYPCGDTALLADAITQALSQPQATRLAWQSRSRARALQFSWSQTAHQTLQSLRQAVSDLTNARREHIL